MFTVPCIISTTNDVFPTNVTITSSSILAMQSDKIILKLLETLWQTAGVYKGRDKTASFFPNRCRCGLLWCPYPKCHCVLWLEAIVWRENDSTYADFSSFFSVFFCTPDFRSARFKKSVTGFVKFNYYNYRYNSNFWNFMPNFQIHEIMIVPSYIWSPHQAIRQ